MTKGEAVDTIMNKFRALTQDRRLSRRYVLAEIEIASKYLIEQKVSEGTMQTGSLYKEIKCLELIKVDRITCPMVELRTCNILMRSKERLPKVLYSSWGPLIKEVTTIDQEKSFKRVTKRSSRRRSMKPKGPKSNDLYYLYEDGYLWIIDTEVYGLNVELITFDDEKVDSLNGCNNKDECKSGWDHDLVLPESITQAVLDKVTQTISINRQIPIDEKADLNEREG